MRPDSPTAVALRRVAARDPWLALHAGAVPSEPGWTRTGQALADPEVLHGLVDGGARAVQDAHPDADARTARAVAAALLLVDWSWGVCAVGAGSVAAAGVVPDLSPESVWLRFAGGRLAGVAVTSARCSAAPGTPGATAVDDVDAALRDALAAALTPLHAALRRGPDPLLRLGPRALWGAVGDAVATALRLQAGEAPPDADVLAVADRLLAAAPRAWGTHGFQRPVDRHGRTHLVRPRSTCCLYYRLPGVEPCSTCPRLTRDQALARLDDLPDPL